MAPGGGAGYSVQRNSIFLVIFFVIVCALVINYRHRVVDSLRGSKVDIEDLIAHLDSQAALELAQAKQIKNSSQKDAKMKVVQVPNCGCEKRIKVIQNGGNFKYHHTTCGKVAFERGSGQKVFSFTYFGSPAKYREREYFEGMARNAEAVKELFPDWTIRIYHNLTDTEDLKQLCSLECKYDHVDMCNVGNNPMLGNMNKVLPTIWRFVPVVDEQVDISNFRDLDSVISVRESAAVADWVRSKHPVHIMRDHTSHDMPILAGMWGAKINKAIPNTWRKVLLAMLHDKISAPPHDYTTSGDQYLLEKYVWPWAKDHSMQHDSYTCEMFSKTLPFPTRREEKANNYVGAPTALQGRITQQCPEKCRPRERKEWTLC